MGFCVDRASRSHVQECTSVATDRPAAFAACFVRSLLGWVCDSTGNYLGNGRARFSHRVEG